MIYETTKQNLDLFHASTNRIRWLVEAQGAVDVRDRCVGAAIYEWWRRADKSGMAAWHKEVITGTGDTVAVATCIGANQGSFTKAPSKLYRFFSVRFGNLRKMGSSVRDAVNNLIADPQLSGAQKNDYLGFDIYSAKTAAGVDPTKSPSLLDKAFSTAKSIVSSTAANAEQTVKDTGTKTSETFYGKTIVSEKAPGVKEAVEEATKTHTAVVDKMAYDITRLRRQQEQTADPDRVAALEAEIARLAAMLAAQPPAPLPPAPPIYIAPETEPVPVPVPEEVPGFFERHQTELLVGGGLLLLAGGVWWYMKRRKAAPPAPGPRPRPVA
jgi:hypothetical protein